MRLDAHDLTVEDTRRFFEESVDEHVRRDFETRGQVDYAHSVSGLGRFRVNAFKTRGSCGLAIRRVPIGATPLAELGLPGIVESMALEPRGLVLVTGPTGSGKTTTLASMVDVINTHRECHIVTIEDPIEVLHPDNRGMINQREVRHDTENFAEALRAAMRQDPDVILVGEMRDEETVRAALNASSTGHLVLSTLHTSDATETVNRIVDFFPPHEQQQTRVALAASLRGIISQRLVQRTGGNGRQLVAEICISNERVAESIMHQELTSRIADIIKDDAYYGMQSFDQHLLELIKTGMIDPNEAVQIASQPHDLVLEMRRLGLVS